jgi:hypothetical protein
MAISDLVPVFDRINKPNFKVIAGSFSAEKIHPKKFFILITSILLACFLTQTMISILVTSDAFALQDLKHERNLVQDERDAILVQVNQKGSPAALAQAAGKLGMKPVDSISYIDMSR